MVRLADMLDVLHARSGGDTRTRTWELDRALSLIETARATGLPASASWSWLTEASVRSTLAGLVPKQSQENRWRAVVAALRSAVLNPTAARRSVVVSDTAADLDMYAVAELCAGEAVRLDRSVDNISEHLRTLANLGEYDRALELGADSEDPYDQLVIGRILTRTERVAEGIERLRRANAPDDPWAVWSLVEGLWLVGRDREAIAVAKDLDASLRGREREADAMSYLCRTALLMDDFERARRVSARLVDFGDNNGFFVQGILDVVDGQPDLARQHLLRYIDNFSTRDDAFTWTAHRGAVRSRVAAIAGPSAPRTPRSGPRRRRVERAIREAPQPAERPGRGDQQRRRSDHRRRGASWSASSPSPSPNTTSSMSNRRPRWRRPI